MINIGTTRHIDNGKYHVSISADDFSEADAALIRKFGDPIINLGGTFTSTDLSFTLADDQGHRLRANSPFQQSFDSADYADAEDRAILWGETIVARIEGAMTTLRDKQDTFTKTTSTTF